MHESFLKDIAVALGVAAIVSIFASRFKIPTVLAYLGAGLIIGPYIPIPLFANPERVAALSELGVILVMFNIGLEFRINRLLQVLPTAGVTALFEISMMGLVGLSLGYLFGWPTEQAIFLGGALAISSTMIVSKVFAEHRPPKEIKEHVLGILIVQDIVAILLLTLLGTFALTKQLEFGHVLPTITKLVSFLILLTAMGILFVPKLIRFVSLKSSVEVLTIVVMGLCFGSAIMVESLGYSVALGAFLAGILVSESGESLKIERVIRPIKDFFAAIFFVSIGMSVNPLVAVEVLPLTFIVTAAVLFFQFHTVFLGGILSGAGAKKSLFAGLALGQIGEFSFIIANIGGAAGIVGDEFQALIVSVAVLSSLSTPLLWQHAQQIVHRAMDLMPESIRITIGLYEAWFDQLRSAAREVDRQRVFGVPKKIMIPLTVDVVLLILLPPALLRFFPMLLEALASDEILRFKDLLVVAVLAVVMAPILYGFVKGTSQLVNHLSGKVFADQGQTMEFEAMRRLFSVMIWTIVIFLVGTPVLSVVRPFTNSEFVIAALAAMLLLTLTWLWRRASEVTDDFKSGGQKIMSVLQRQTFAPTGAGEARAPINVPGLENIEPMLVTNRNLLGKSLAELSLRNVTGVTVVAIQRGEQQILFPNQHEALLEGDILQIWGEAKAKKKCRSLLSLSGGSPVTEALAAGEVSGS